MSRGQEFLKSTVIGGLLVILPTAILLFVFTWVFGLVQKLISPLTGILREKSVFQGIIADLLVLALVIAICFAVGVIVRTRLGKWTYSKLESQILLKAPGYSLIKQTLAQFLGQKKTPFSSVALCRIYSNETLVTAFVTDEHSDGSYTVFVPTGPNPTSGNIFHLPAANVYPVNVSIEDTMRSIISCGAGSDRLIEKLQKPDQA